MKSNTDSDTTIEFSPNTSYSESQVTGIKLNIINQQF